MQLTEPVSPIERWALDPAILHLNHGSYGGCLRTVVDAAAAWRARLEAAPMQFLVLHWQTELDRARAALAAFLGAPADRLVYLPNATTGVAIALASSPLATGDELVTTDHAYRACRNQLDRLAAARGLRITAVPIALPFDPDAFVDAFTRAVTSRTRLALLDHVTSSTALRLPLERMLPALAGITVVVDGAHAPGQLPLDISALLAAGATYYAGNNHKWLGAPKGTGFLVAAPGAPVIPVVTSHGASPSYGPPNRLHAELDWSGTHDPAAHLAVPVAIAAIAVEGGGWPAVIARNHALVVALRERFVDALGGGGGLVPGLAPDAALGAMAAVPIELPAGVAPLALERELLAAGIEVPIVEFASGPLVRLSAHLYNHAAQADELARKLAERGVRLRRM